MTENHPILMVKMQKFLFNVFRNAASSMPVIVISSVLILILTTTNSLFNRELVILVLTRPANLLTGHAVCDENGPMSQKKPGTDDKTDFHY